VIPQAACVPYRPCGAGYEILLITTRKGKWTIPKGIVDPGETPQQTALKEAFEEAGVRGKLEGGPIASFTYRKWGEVLEVAVYLLQVESVEEDFEEASFRRRRWFRPEEAVSCIRKRIRPALKQAVALLDRRFGRTGGPQSEEGAEGPSGASAGGAEASSGTPE